MASTSAGPSRTVRRARASPPLMKVRPPGPTQPGGTAAEERRELEETVGDPPEEIERFIHGTTVATNAVLERKGREIGPADDRGLQGRPRDRAADAPDLYGSSSSRKRRFSWRPARSARRSASASRPGRGRRAARRGVGARRRGDAGRGRRPGDRRLLPVLVPRSRARAAAARDHPRAPSRPDRLAIVRGGPGLPRIRAHRASRRSTPTSSRSSTVISRDLEDELAAPASRRRCRSCSRAAASPAPGRAAEAGAAVPVRPGGRRDRRRDRRPRGRASRT